MNEQQRIDEENKQVELTIGKIMQVGVIAAAVVILFGLVLYFTTGTSGYPGTSHPHTVRTILAGTLALRPYAVMMTGIFLLILTPVLRVVVSIYAFAHERDWLYTAITISVLIILMIAMIIGYAG